ncbi:MAG: amino acid-binding protein [Rikenellaceae bacterium]
MKIKQLSIFIENRVGEVNEVISVLSNADISIRAFSLADGIDFGILRIIVPDTDYAQKVMQDAGYKVSQTDVLCVEVPNIAGGILTTFNAFAQQNIFIQYMYSFSDNEVAKVIIRTNDIERSVEILSSQNV